MTKAGRFCTFFLGQTLLGIAVEQVREVLGFRELTRVPLAPAAVRGIINLRGEIVTAIDLRRRLELPAEASGRQPMNVIVHSGESVASLLVDEIGGVVEVTEENLEAPPAHLNGPSQDLIAAVCKLQDRVLLILNVERTLELGAGARK